MRAELKAFGYNSGTAAYRRASGSINISVTLFGKFREFCPIKIKKSLTFPVTLSAKLTDAPLKLAVGSINLPVALDSAPPKITEAPFKLNFALSAEGHVVHLFGGIMEALPTIASGGQVFSGPGTINGERLNVIADAFGSREYYPNSQGGYYTIGTGDAIKSAEGTIIIAPRVSAIGSGDALKYRSGTTIIAANMAAVATTNVPTSIDISATLKAVKGARGSISISVELDLSKSAPATIAIGASLSAGTDITISVRGSIQVRAALSADAESSKAVVLSLAGENVIDSSAGLRDTFVAIGLLNDGQVKRDDGAAGPQIIDAPDWASQPIASSQAAEYEARATVISGDTPSGAAVNVWHNLGTSVFWQQSRQVSQGVGVTGGLLSITVRQVSNTSNSVTQTYQLQATQL